MVKSLCQINASVSIGRAKCFLQGRWRNPVVAGAMFLFHTPSELREWDWVGSPYLGHPCFLWPAPCLPWRPTFFSCSLPPSTEQFGFTGAAAAPGCSHCAEKTWSTFSWDVGRARAETAPLLGYGCLLLSQQERKEQVGVRKQFFSHCCMSNRPPIVLFTLLANSKILVPGGFARWQIF